MDEGIDLRGFIELIPKAELHVHLEGAFPARTLLRLARRRGVELPAGDEDGLASWFRFDNFEQFLAVYLTCSSCLQEPEDFALLINDFAADQARQNILYTEAHFTVSTHAANGVDVDEVADAMTAAVEESERRLGVQIRLIPDIVRNVGVELADLTLEWALRHRGRLTVALGLSGIESYPATPFQRHFDVAGRERLHRVVHAGEQSGPRAVWSALDECDAERIGHGIAAVQDDQLMRRLTADRVPLEVSPTSNILLGYATGYATHPIWKLRREGIELSVNSDDPAFFATTLCDEYMHLAEAQGLGATEIAELALAAWRQSFLPREDRVRFEADFRRQAGALLGSLGKPLSVVEEMPAAPKPGGEPPGA